MPTTTTSNNFLNYNNAIKLTTWSMLDANFDNNDEELDELEHYISENPANKKINILAC